MPSDSASPTPKERVVAFGGHLPRRGMRAASTSDLVRRLTASGNLRPGPAGVDDLYDRYTTISARDPRNVTVHGRKRANVDKDTGDAALGWLGVDPALATAQHIKAPRSNRTSANVNQLVYASKGVKADQRHAVKAGTAAPVYVGLAGGRTRRDGGGVVVTAVAPESPLAQAGVQQGDVILSVAQHRIQDSNRLREVGAGMKPGKPYLFRIERDGQHFQATVRPDEPGTAS